MRHGVERVKREELGKQTGKEENKRQTRLEKKKKTERRQRGKRERERGGVRGEGVRAEVSPWVGQSRRRL